MFSFTIQYRKGIKNGNADALSRLPTEPDEDEDKELWCVVGDYKIFATKKITKTACIFF